MTELSLVFPNYPNAIRNSTMNFTGLCESGRTNHPPSPFFDRTNPSPSPSSSSEPPCPPSSSSSSEPPPPPYTGQDEATKIEISCLLALKRGQKVRVVDDKIVLEERSRFARTFSKDSRKLTMTHLKRIFPNLTNEQKTQILQHFKDLYGQKWIDTLVLSTNPKNASDIPECCHKAVTARGITTNEFKDNFVYLQK